MGNTTIHVIIIVLCGDYVEIIVISTSCAQLNPATARIIVSRVERKLRK